MSKIKIVTDSSCTMEQEAAKELGITIVPLSVMIDSVIHMDDENYSGEMFMEQMASSQTLPKTSQPPIGVFTELYDKLGEDGSQILSIHMSEKLSGTVNAARQAAELSQADVTVIDSHFTDQALSFQVISAAKLANEQVDLAEILNEIKKIEENTKLYIGVATLENLVKGGRISRVAGFLSSFLNMKVIMEFRNDELIVQTKGRGGKTFTKWFEEFKTELDKIQLTETIKQIGISYAGKAEIVKKFKEELQKLFPSLHIPLLHTNPIISTHTGEGAFAIMYYTESKN